MKKVLLLSILLIQVSCLTLFGQQAPINVTIDQPVNNNPSPVNPQSVWISVEQYPQFKGGLNNFNKFVSNNLIYPKEMKDNNIAGRVLVQFVVDIDGTLTNIRLKAPFGYSEADEEALRVVRLSPKWLPGLQGGKPVKCLYVVPIFFKLPQ